MTNQDYTMKFEGKFEKKINEKEVLDLVTTALIEKGYNPVNQLVGYLLSGDPSYITSHNDARTIIHKFERDELLEEILNSYLKQD